MKIVGYDVVAKIPGVKTTRRYFFTTKKGAENQSKRFKKSGIKTIKITPVKRP